MPRKGTTVTTPLLYTTPWSSGSSCQAVLGSTRVHRPTTATETFALARTEPTRARAATDDVPGAFFWMMLAALTRPEVVLLTPLFWIAIHLGLFLQTPSTQTITRLPSFFVSEFSDDQTKVVASAVITAIPETIAYLCLQRLFERGLTAGALK